MLLMSAMGRKQTLARWWNLLSYRSRTVPIRSPARVDWAGSFSSSPNDLARGLSPSMSPGGSRRLLPSAGINRLRFRAVETAVNPIEGDEVGEIDNPPFAPFQGNSLQAPGSAPASKRPDCDRTAQCVASTAAIPL